jgi:hypothetical protein
MKKWKVYYMDFNGFVREYIHYGDLSNLFSGVMLPDSSGYDSIIKIKKVA